MTMRLALEAVRISGMYLYSTLASEQEGSRIQVLRDSNYSRRWFLGFEGIVAQKF